MKELKNESHKFAIIIITSPFNFPNETELINFFLNKGTAAIYLRKDNYPNGFIKSFFERIKNEYHKKIILPFSVVDDLIYEKYKPIIHFKEKERLVEKLHNTNADAILSTSIHDFSELENISKRFNYIFYSPVFESISKINYKPKLSIEEIIPKVKNFKLQISNSKLIALGGIDDENILQIKNAGFDGVALLGAIWEKENQKEMFLKIVSKIK